MPKSTEIAQSISIGDLLRLEDSAVSYRELHVCSFVISVDCVGFRRAVSIFQVPHQND